VFRIPLADDARHATPTDHPTVLADRLYTRTDFHNRPQTWICSRACQYRGGLNAMQGAVLGGRGTVGPDPLGGPLPHDPDLAQTPVAFHATEPEKHRLAPDLVRAADDVVAGQLRVGVIVRKSP